MANGDSWFARMSDVKEEIRIALELERGHVFSALGKLINQEKNKLLEKIDLLEKEIKNLKEGRGREK